MLLTRLFGELIIIKFVFLILIDSLLAERNVFRTVYFVSCGSLHPKVS